MLFRNKQENTLTSSLAAKARRLWIGTHKTFVVLTISLILVVFGIINSASAKPAADMTPTESAKSWLYYNSLSACIDDSYVYLIDSSNWWLGMRNDRISASNATAGKWFDNPTVGATNPSLGYFLSGKPGISTDGDKVGCGGTNTNWILDAIKLWGYSSNIDALCSFGAKRANGSDCRDGSGDFTGESSLGHKLSIDKFRSSVKDKIGATPSLSDAAKYVLYRDSFYAGCLGNTSPTAYTGNANDQYTYTIKIVTSKGDTSTDIKYYGIRKHSDNIDFYVDSDGNNQGDECIAIANEINRLSGSYEKSVSETNPDTDKEDEGEVVATDSCSIESIGWIVCPVMNFMAKVIDGAYSVVAMLLETPSVNMDLSNPQNGTYQAWSIMRTIANVAFVIAFLIIIFSQITSIGLTNYGIKKMLPRIVIAAILVNVSYYICAIGVDISNIFGGSLKSLFDNISNQIPQIETFGNTGNIWTGAITAVLAATATLYVGLSALLPALIAALAAIVTVFLVLTLRQALIIVLIVVSPLAFVAFLLPNTENYFKKWKDLLMTMLLMYPVIAVIFGASSLASKVIMASSTSIPVQIMGALVAIVPLAITPIVMKAAGGLLSKIGAIVDNPNKGIFDRMNKGAENLRKREVNRMNNAALNKSGGFSPRRSWLRYTARTAAIDENQQREATRAKTSYIAGLTGESSSFSSKMTKGGTEGSLDRARASAQSVLDTLEGQEVSAASVLIRNRLTKIKAGADAKDEYGKQYNNPDDFLRDVAMKGSSNQSMAALNELAKMGRDGVLRPMVGSSDVDQSRLQSAISSNFGSLKDKAPDLVKGSGPAFNAVTGSALASFSKQTSAAYMKYLDDLNTTAESIKTATTQEQIDAANKAKETLDSAITAFNSSIEDIKINPTLQSSFVGESGKSILDSAPSALKDRLSGLNYIDDSTGKIRS